MKDTKTPDIFDLSSIEPKCLAGVDEAGRGPLAGPVTAAAVILDPDNPIEGLRDSKKLSAARREQLAAEIKQKALAWSVAHASVEEIDSLNILQATFLAMQRAVEGLGMKPDWVYVDGNRLPRLPYRMLAVVKGDDKVPAISAASIIAKTTRDALVDTYESQYPGYGFARHKGYGTKEHVEAIRQKGVLPVHRRTFEPIASILRSNPGHRTED